MGPQITMDYCESGFIRTQKPEERINTQQAGNNENRAGGIPGTCGLRKPGDISAAQDCHAGTSLTRRPKASTCCQSVNSITAFGSVGPFVISMMSLISWRSINRYLG